MKNKNTKTDTSKSTILIISMGFLALYVFSLLKWPDHPWIWALYISLGVGIIGALSTYLGEKIEWVWMKLSKLLSYIVPNVLLSLVFYLFLFPISLLSKLFSKDPLMLSKKHPTYFININKEPDKKSFERIF
jgi:hypothetical protein